MSTPRRPAAPRSGQSRAGDDRDRERGVRSGGPAKTPAERRPAARPAVPSPSPRTAPDRTAARPAAARRAGVPTPRRGVGRVGTTPSSTPRDSASRPAGRGPGGRGSAPWSREGRAESVQQRVPRLFTIRVMVLAAVACLAFVLVFPTLHSYLAQRQDLEKLDAQVTAAQARNDDLQAELDRWSDPAYVEAQARERLSYVMPGERALRVSDPQTVVETVVPDDATVGDGAVIGADSTVPWYSQIWSSVEIAGDTPVATGGGTSEDNGTAPTDQTEPTDPSGSTAPTDPAAAPAG